MKKVKIPSDHTEPSMQKIEPPYNREKIHELTTLLMKMKVRYEDLKEMVDNYEVFLKYSEEHRNDPFIY